RDHVVVVTGQRPLVRKRNVLLWNEVCVFARATVYSVVWCECVCVRVCVCVLDTFTSSESSTVFSSKVDEVIPRGCRTAGCVCACVCVCVCVCVGVRVYSAKVQTGLSTTHTRTRTQTPTHTRARAVTFFT